MEGSDAGGVVFLQYLGENISNQTTGSSREKLIYNIRFETVFYINENNRTHKKVGG